MPQSSIETSLYGFLTASTQITAATDGKIYPVKLPQGTTPPKRYLTYTLVSNPRQYTVDGQSPIGNARFQLDAWAVDYADAKLIAHAVAATQANGGLSGFLGTFPDGTHIIGAFIGEEIDGLEPPFADDGGGYYRVSLDVILWSST